MKVTIPPSWHEDLNAEFEKAYFSELENFVEIAYSQNICFPPEKEIFNAFNYCPFDEVKVVILGQDPYHGFGQANGLCFSVNDGVSFPPSLVNIFKEIESDIGEPIPISGNLSRWAEQGVFLLNATLTVQEGMAGSHQKKGWETFTDAVIQLISQKKEKVVFMLWGGFAQKKSRLIDAQKHLILTAGHPSPLSANRGFWFGNQHFSKCNQYLKDQQLEPIEW